MVVVLFLLLLRLRRLNIAFKSALLPALSAPTVSAVRVVLLALQVVLVEFLPLVFTAIMGLDGWVQKGKASG